MFSKIRLLSFTILVLATIIGFAFAPSNSAQAIQNPATAGLNGVTNITAQAGCTVVDITVSLADDGEPVMDNGAFDNYTLVVYDGAGTVIAIDDAFSGAALRPAQIHTINDTHPNNPASYPFEVRMYDVVATGNQLADIPAIEASPLIDTLAGIDPTGFAGALGCNLLPNATNVTLDATATCVQVAGVNDGTVDIDINAGDGPFDITTSNGGNQLGVAAGTYNFANGPTWANITVTETGGDTENIAFNNIDCTPPVTNVLTVTAACVGANLRVNIIGGDGPFDIDINAGGIVQNGVAAGIYNFPGPATWTAITVTETAFDNEVANLGNRTCTTPPAGGGGGGAPAATTATNVPTPPDNRLNWGHGDHLGILYPSQDTSGNPSIELYCLNEQGAVFLGFHITFAMIAGYDTNPSVNTEVARNNDCPAAFYILDTGEYQVNIGPDAEGKTEVVIFNDLFGGDIYFYTLYGAPGGVPGSAATNSSSSSNSSAGLPGAYTPLSNCRVTTTDMVNFRTFPVTGDVITIIPFDYEMTAHARSGDWFEVTFMGDTGWISDGFASTWGNCG